MAAMAVAVILLAASAGGKGGGAGHHASPAWMAAVMVPSAIAGLLVAAGPLRRRPGGQRAPAAAVSFGLGTGLLYGVAALAIKGLSGVLTGQHGAASLLAGVVASPYLYVLAGSSAAGMLLYQAGLQSCRASILVPVSTVTGSVYFLIAGTLLFHEHLPAARPGSGCAWPRSRWPGSWSSPYPGRPGRGPRSPDQAAIPVYLTDPGGQ